MPSREIIFQRNMGQNTSRPQHRNHLGFLILPKEILSVILQYLSIADAVRANAVRKQSSFFQNNAQKASKTFYEARLALPLLQAVISGRLGADSDENDEYSLIHLVRKNPDALFMKGDVSFPDSYYVYLLNDEPKNFSKYKGHYVYTIKNELIYIHYNGLKEVVELKNKHLFDKSFQKLPKDSKDTEQEMLKTVVLNHKQIKLLITNNSSNHHRPIPHQYFYDVSPFQLIYFYCDIDMLNHIMRVISPLSATHSKLIETQLQILGFEGPANIVKVNKCPVDPTFRFNDILYYKKSYQIGASNPSITQEVTHLLLENQNGVIYFKDSQNQIHWYRADIHTQTIEVLEIKNNTLKSKEQNDFNQMIHDLDQMEDMSAKRTSQHEHRLLTKIFNFSIHQEGITFDLEGIRFKSGCYDFNRQDNAYRKSHRLFIEKKQDAGKQACVEQLGHMQKECAWKLLRLNDENLLNDPLSVDYLNLPFKRNYFVKISCGYEDNTIPLLPEFKHFIPGLGAYFAILIGQGANYNLFIDYFIIEHTQIALELFINTLFVQDAKSSRTECLQLNYSPL